MTTEKLEIDIDQLPPEFITALVAERVDLGRVYGRTPSLTEVLTLWLEDYVSMIAHGHGNRQSIRHHRLEACARPPDTGKIRHLDPWTPRPLPAFDADRIRAEIEYEDEPTRRQLTSAIVKISRTLGT